MSDYQCTPGHAQQCATATSPKCHCACGGHNHGNPAALGSSQEDMMGRLTDTRIFNPEPGEDYQRILPGGVGHDDIVLRRTESGTAASIDQRWKVHSPTGFEWGYGGSGPADLALNILGLFVPPPEAWHLHQRFKWDVIAPLPRDVEKVVISSHMIVEWIIWQWEKEEHDYEREAAP